MSFLHRIFDALYIYYFAFLTKFLFDEVENCNAPRRIHDSQEARLILRTSSLESRALPNQRLVKAFGIDNAFTSTDPEYHRRFVNEAKGLIRTQNREWKDLAFAATAEVSSGLAELQSDESTEGINLESFVRCLVFRIVVLKFFPRVGRIEKDDVEFITTAINDLWVSSKCCNEQDSVAVLNVTVTQLRLLGKLRPYFDDPTMTPIGGKDNPLNIILPAYETLWRVVICCFLEVRFKSSDEELITYTKMFNSFFSNPNPGTLDYLHATADFTVKNIIDEALRLYPPTRRIYRQTEEGRVAIDVEYLHRDPTMLGTDALNFSPGRWFLKKSAGLPYMPFGMGSFECPAKNLLGPMMIGVLVAGLMDQVGEGFEIVDCQGKSDALGPEPLDGGRRAFAGLELRSV